MSLKCVKNLLRHCLASLDELVKLRQHPCRVCSLDAYRLLDTEICVVAQKSNSKLTYVSRPRTKPLVEVRR